MRIILSFIVLTYIFVSFLSLQSARAGQDYLGWRSQKITRAPAGFEERTPAAINRAAIAIARPSKIFYGTDGHQLSPDIIALFHSLKAEEKPIDMTAYIPMDMVPSNDSNKVFQKVADRSVSTWFNSPAVRGSAIGRAATEVEESVHQEITFGDSEEIEHKLGFNFQAFQALAQIEYTGYVHAALRYYGQQALLSFEVDQTIAQNQDLILGHDVHSEDRLSRLSFRWSF